MAERHPDLGPELLDVIGSGGPWKPDPELEVYERDRAANSDKQATTIDGFRAWAIRHERGYWCGYLEVPAGIPLDLKVHGADSCGNGINIAYTPEGEPGMSFSEGVAPGHIVHGFDCGHLEDWKPGGINTRTAKYRTLGFVQAELVRMAAQARLELAALAKSEAIDHPKHYGGADDPYEAIKVMEAWHGPEPVYWFCLLSAEKYQSRMGKKPGEPMERDVKKAAWYLAYAAKLREKIEAK